jgi:tetratricopeptide (TPR) repeat protein
MRAIWVTVLGLGMTASVAHAQLAPPRQAVDEGSSRSRELASRASESLTRQQPAQALQMAEQAIAADALNPWGHYNRAAALADLGRVDAAVADFQAAERLFSTADAWGKSISMYGRANVLAQAGRCSEAGPAFEEYARYVERADAGAAALARRYATECKPRR